MIYQSLISQKIKFWINQRIIRIIIKVHEGDDLLHEIDEVLIVEVLNDEIYEVVQVAQVCDDEIQVHDPQVYDEIDELQMQNQILQVQHHYPLMVVDLVWNDDMMI